MNERLKKQLDFMLELDKMKSIYRQTYVLHEDRKENDAEHSWHLAILAFMLEEYAAEPIDTLKVIKMVLLHDVVEIDAGDTYAQRIFGLLPDDQRDEYYALWREFEDDITYESRFASILDRMQPLLLNYTKGGIAWKEHGVHKEQVLSRNRPYFDASHELAEVIESVIEDAAAKGWLKA